MQEGREGEGGEAKINLALCMEKSILYITKGVAMNRYVIMNPMR